MLGRVANNLFWMSRYLERAENNARIVEAYLRRSLAESDQAVQNWIEVLGVLGQKDAYETSKGEFEQRAIINFILRDKTNPISVLNLIHQSRQNARIVRGALTREAWQAINDLWLSMQMIFKSPININELPLILAKVQQGSALVRGVLDGTMLRNDIFYFLRAGTAIERGDNTARIIHKNYFLFLPSAFLAREDRSISKVEAVLDSAGAMRAYNWLNKGRVDPGSVILFLVADKSTPRSLSYCYQDIVRQLTALEEVYDTSFDACQKAKQVQAGLNSSSTGGLHLDELQNFAHSFIQNNAQLSDLIETEFKFYR